MTLKDFKGHESNEILINDYCHVVLLVDLSFGS